MNIYGNDTGAGLTQGGEIDGDLDITGDLNINGDLDVANLNVSDTATITTLITQQELEILDPLITLAVDNNSDSINIGLLEEYTSGVKKWAGLIRNKTDKEHYLLEQEIIKPTPTGTVPATAGLLSLGTLNTKVLKSFTVNANDLNVIDGFFRFKDDMAVTTWAMSGTDTVFNLTQSGGNPLSINKSTNMTTLTGLTMDDGSASPYTLPPADGTAGYLLKTDGSGTLDWIASTAMTPSLQDTYNIDSTITTTLAKPRLILKQGLGGLAPELFEMKNSSDVSRVLINTAGLFQLSGNSAAIQLNDTNNVKKWRMLNNGADDSWNLLNSSDGLQLKVTQGGLLSARAGLEIGITPTHYSLPLARGSDNQILQTDTVGIVSWEDLPATPSLQDVYDVDSTITTTAAKTTLTIVKDDVETNLFKINDGTDDTIKLYSDGSIENHNIILQDTLQADQFEIIADGAELKIRNAGLTQENMVMSQNGDTIFNIAGNERVKIDTFGIHSTNGKFDQMTLKNNLDIDQFHFHLATADFELRNLSNVPLMTLTQTGSTLFQVSGADVLEITAGGVDITGIGTMGTLEATLATVSKVGYKNGTGDDRFTQEWLADDLLFKSATKTLQTTDQTGASTFSVNDLPILNITAAGIDVSGALGVDSVKVDSVQYKNATDVTRFTTEWNTDNLETKNAAGAVLQSVTQNGNLTLSVTGTPVLDLDTNGIKVYQSVQAKRVKYLDGSNDPRFEVDIGSDLLRVENAAANVIHETAQNGTTTFLRSTGQILLDLDTKMVIGDLAVQHGLSALSQYTMPADAASVVDGSVLMFDQASRDVLWQVPVSANMTFGGKLDGVGKYLIVFGNTAINVNNTLDYSKEFICCADAWILGVTWSSKEADATTRLELWINGVGLIGDLIVCDGAQGFYDFPAAISVSKGDRVAMSLQAGQKPSEMHALVCTKYRHT